MSSITHNNKKDDLILELGRKIIQIISRIILVVSIIGTILVQITQIEWLKTAMFLFLFGATIFISLLLPFESFSLLANVLDTKKRLKELIKTYLLGCLMIIIWIINKILVFEEIRGKLFLLALGIVGIALFNDAGILYDKKLEMSKSKSLLLTIFLIIGVMLVMLGIYGFFMINVEALGNALVKSATEVTLSQ